MVQGSLFLGTNIVGIDWWGMGEKETKKEKTKHSFLHEHGREEKDASLSERDGKFRGRKHTKDSMVLFPFALCSFVTE